MVTAICNFNNNCARSLFGSMPTSDVAAAPFGPFRHFAIHSARLCVAAGFANKSRALSPAIRGGRGYGAHLGMVTTTTKHIARPGITPSGHLAVLWALCGIAQPHLRQRGAWQSSVQWMHRNGARARGAPTTTRLSARVPSCPITCFAVHRAWFRVTWLELHKHWGRAYGAAIRRGDDHGPCAHAFTVFATSGTAQSVRPPLGEHTVDWALLHVAVRCRGS
jgi:hypothetical protein